MLLNCDALIGLTNASAAIARLEDAVDVLFPRCSTHVYESAYGFDALAKANEANALNARYRTIALKNSA